MNYKAITKWAIATLGLCINNIYINIYLIFNIYGLYCIVSLIWSLRLSWPLHLNLKREHEYVSLFAGVIFFSLWGDSKAATGSLGSPNIFVGGCELVDVCFSAALSSISFATCLIFLISITLDYLRVLGFSSTFLFDFSSSVFFDLTSAFELVSLIGLAICLAAWISRTSGSWMLVFL